jgi:AraC-like DNA-binding protein
LIELHYRQNLSVEAFASLLGVTRPHLHDTCLRGTGRTPLALIHDRVISEAKLMLEQTELLVEQVAYGLGFREPAYFNRFFKRMTARAVCRPYATAIGSIRPVKVQRLQPAFQQPQRFVRSCTSTGLP